MSHVTRVDSVPIESIEAVRAAVKELQGQGIKIELVAKQAPRMFFPHHETECDWVLKLQDCVYDIGLEAKKDTNGKFTHFEPMLDVYKDKIHAILGNEHTEGTVTEKAIGKFLSAYQKNNMMITAKKQGYNVRGTQVDKNGNLNLVLVQR